VQRARRDADQGLDLRAERGRDLGALLVVDEARALPRRPHGPRHNSALAALRCRLPASNVSQRSDVDPVPAISPYQHRVSAQPPWRFVLQQH
jgi:hypothetical protein